MRFWTAFLASLACLYGGSGVAGAAAAAHISGGGSAATSANFLLFHAGALAALATAASSAERPLPLCLAASLIALGVALFSGDLAARGLAGVSLLRMMAPSGGVLMIAGWLLAAVALPLALRRDARLVR